MKLHDPNSPPLEIPDPPHVVTATLAFLYTSCAVSFLAATFAGFGRTWLKEYFRHEGRSIAERCAVRQHKSDMAKKMWFEPVLKVIIAMPHTIALPLLTCGFCLHVSSPVLHATYPLFGSIFVGILFFLTLSVAGTLDATPFRTWWSAPVTPMAKSERWKTNSDDAQCTAWIIPSNTDKRVFDAIIPHTTTIPWFKDGLNTEPPHSTISSALTTCFDSSGLLRPGVRDRAFHSAQALLWLYTCARCESEELAQRFPLPNIPCLRTLPDPDIQHLLATYSMQDVPAIISWMYKTGPGLTPLYLQWVSGVLLHLSWAVRGGAEAFNPINDYSDLGGSWSTAPLNAILDRLLTSSLFLGCPFEEDLLRAQNKWYAISYHTLQATNPSPTSEFFDRVLNHFSKAAVSGIQTSHPRRGILWGLLASLRYQGKRTEALVGMAYSLCCAICEHYTNLADGKRLLLLALEVGFRFDPGGSWAGRVPGRMRHNALAGRVVFGTGDGEQIADLLCAWLTECRSAARYDLLGSHMMRIIGLCNMQSFSPRLRRVLIRVIGGIFPGVLPLTDARFTALLDKLHIRVKDVKGDSTPWAELLLDIIDTPGGAQRLSRSNWQLLVELSALSQSSSLKTRWSAFPVGSLEAGQEWDKLEDWVGFAWVVWPLEGHEVEDHIKHATLISFRQRPSGVKRIRQLMEQRGGNPVVPDLFQRICEQVDREALSQAGP